MLFKKGLEKLFAPDSFIWDKDAKAEADFVQCIKYDAEELKRQAQELDNE